MSQKVILTYRFRKKKLCLPLIHSWLIYVLSSNITFTTSQSEHTFINSESTYGHVWMEMTDERSLCESYSVQKH